MAFPLLSSRTCLVVFASLLLICTSYFDTTIISPIKIFQPLPSIQSNTISSSLRSARTSTNNKVILNDVDAPSHGKEIVQVLKNETVISIKDLESESNITITAYTMRSEAAGYDKQDDEMTSSSLRLSSFSKAETTTATTTETTTASTTAPTISEVSSETIQIAPTPITTATVTEAVATAEATGTTTNTKEQDGPKLEEEESIPSIAFMFMMSDKPLNEEMWEAWFNGASDKRKYSIFVHGLPSNSTVPLGKFMCQYAIPSVPTRWYYLYEGMIQLLSTAHKRDPNAQSFVFVSSTSIPLVSFDEFYNSVVQDNINKRSRFCFMTDGKDWAWKGIANKLGFDPINDTQKAEMWSIISRYHADVLLGSRTTMDEWNEMFKATPRTGAPDENIFPTMININIQPNNLDNEFYKCSAVKPDDKSNRNSCCSHHVSWGSSDDRTPMSVPTPSGTALLTDKCPKKRGSPCTAQTLYEEGLIALRNQGYFFLRKVENWATVKTIANETISMNDALIQLHAKQPISSTNIIVNPSVSSNNDIKGFHCPAPKLLENE